MHLPKLIHQTWKNKVPHPALRCCVESFQFMNPGWTVRYYTDEDCLVWVRKHCPELRDAYLSFPRGIHRADLFRILVLYFEGGVYADIDIECIRPLDELLARLDENKSVFLTRDHPVHERIHFSGRLMYMNDFMIAQPGDPLIEEILKWMLRCPPISKSSADAVMDTGPGVVSSVIEMLGGPGQLANLQEMPTHWIHSLPDMNCRFHESQFYRAEIAAREWLKRDVYVVHYWFHTWVDGVNGKNNLTDHADVLLSTRGEQVERILQWHLGATPSDLDAVIACAVAEFTEIHGTVILYVDRESDPLMDRFLELLRAAGIKPKLLAIATGDAEGLTRRLDMLKEGGVATVRASQMAQSCCNGVSSKVLLVAAPSAKLNEPWLCRHIQGVGGFVLGPDIDWARKVNGGDGVSLSEVCSKDQLVPRIVHLLPDHGHSVPDLAESLAEHEFSIRLWTGAEAIQMLNDLSLGVCDWSLVPKEEKQFLIYMAIIYIHGGVVFQGDRLLLTEQLQRECRTTFSQGKDTWLLACPPKSVVVSGAIQHWQSVSRKGMPCEVKDFLRERVSTLSRLGHVQDLHASHVKPHPFLL